MGHSEHIDRLDAAGYHKVVKPSPPSPKIKDILFESEEMLARPLVLTPLGQVTLWEKMSKFPILFAGVSDTNFERFKEVLEDEETILLGFHEGGENEPCGLGMITDILPGIEAKIQISFFDQRLKGREDFVRKFVKWVFDTFLVRRVAAYIRADARAMRAFMERVGLYFEGVTKNWIKKGHKYYDLYQFAICDFECDDLWLDGRSWAKPRVRLLEIYERK